MFARLVRVDPTVSPVTRDEAKSWLRVNHSHEDSLIDDLLLEATEYVEEQAEIQLSTVTWQWIGDGFPLGRMPIELNIGPVQSINSFQYVDTDGNTQSLTSADYRTAFNRMPGRLEPAYGESWPTTRNVVAAVTLDFEAGYSNVPTTAKRAIKYLVEDAYANRGPVGATDKADRWLDQLRWRLYA